MRYLVTVFFSLILCTGQLSAEQAKKVCLNMIVKDESKIIERCLESVKPLIDTWVIVDTGSTDGTQKIIKNFMKDIPGELHERPWVNFAHNRNEALELAKNKAEYILFMDADDVMSIASGFKMPPLDKDFYYLTIDYSGTRYGRVQIIKTALNWKWEGVLHEAVMSSQAKSSGLIEGLTTVVTRDGSRAKDPDVYKKDAEILEAAMLKEPNNARYQFYLAQSYRDSQQYELSIKNYEKRVAMGGWDEEVYWSLLQIGILNETLQKSPEIIIASYNRAYLFRPSRAEAMYRLASFQRRQGNYHAGYEASIKGLSIPPSKDLLFVEQWIYDYGLLLEYSICAYWIDHFVESFVASNLMLANPNLPQNFKECVTNNMAWIHQKLREQSLSPLDKNDLIISLKK